MRIRTIKPEFWQSERMATVSREARLLFVGLWSMADDSGRTRAASRLLASTLFPYDEDARTLIDGWMDELVKIGCVRLYQVDGLHYLDIPKWCEHQKIDKPSKSKLPEFVDSSRGLDEDSRKIALDQGSGIRDQGVAASPSAPASPIRTRAKDEWRYTQGEPWVREGRKAGCDIKGSNWELWCGAIARTGGDHMKFFAMAESMPPEKRWPEKIEAAMSVPKDNAQFGPRYLQWVETGEGVEPQAHE